MLTLVDRETLRYEPAPELAALRRNARAHTDLDLEPDREIASEASVGLHVEIEA